jgi:hypothetical protein
MPLLLGLGNWHKVRSYWEDAEEHIGNNQSQNTHTSHKRNLGASCLTSLAARFFFAYPCSLPFLAQANGRGMN